MHLTRFRHPVVAALAKQWADDGTSRISSLDKAYNIETSFLTEYVRERVQPVKRDAGVNTFLEYCSNASRWRQMASMVLRWFRSRTDANAIAGCGDMYVLSPEMATTIIGKVLPLATPCKTLPASITHNGPEDGLRLLDVGAGSGSATAQIAHLFAHITATEVSTPMCSRLADRGYEVIETDSIARGRLGSRFGTYDAISLLNVLDRVSEPATLLQQCRESLLARGSHAVLIIAVVLPFHPGVEVGVSWEPPHQRLPISSCNASCCFEGCVNELVHNVLLPAGFEPVVISRAAYISQGNDLNDDFCWLSNAIVVARAVPDAAVGALVDKATNMMGDACGKLMLTTESAVAAAATTAAITGVNPEDVPPEASKSKTKGYGAIADGDDGAISAEGLPAYDPLRAPAPLQFVPRLFQAAMQPAHRAHLHSRRLQAAASKVALAAASAGAVAGGGGSTAGDLGLGLAFVGAAVPADELAARKLAASKLQAALRAHQEATEAEVHCDAVGGVSVSLSEGYEPMVSMTEEMPPLQDRI